MITGFKRGKMEKKFKLMTEQLRLLNSDQEVAEYITWLITSDTAKEHWSPQWIKVTDRLPEERMTPCLAFNGDAPEYNQHVFQSVYYRNIKNFIISGTMMGSVTHWMPLPEPPEV